VWILLLGPTELLSTDAAAVHVGGARRRAVLAALAVRLNHVVTIDRLADIVWDGEPPRQATPALQGHVAALRRLLPKDLVLETHDSSYRLAGEPDLIDCHRFDKLVARGAAATTDPEASNVFEQALSMWRGSAFADLATNEFFRSQAEHLHDARLRALEAWAQCEVRQGRGGRMTPMLRAMAQTAPLRQTLLSTLMLCLHQEGRQSEAIEMYHRARERLNTELGILPGPDLQVAFAQVLQEPTVLDGPGTVEAPCPAEPTGTTSDTSVTSHPAPAYAGPSGRTHAEHVPRQLPRRPPIFIGRAEQCAWLDQVCGAAGESPLAVVTGPAGVGKTTLVLHWAHAAGERFPDGQLFADLYGFDGSGGEDPALVLARFLLALGMPEDEIPASADERTALFRMLTTGRRMLVVLDNAMDADTVRRLLPGDSGCATVVTSRATMRDLTVGETGASQVLPPFSPREAITLLGQCVGGERIHRESREAIQMAELCGNLPLALRVCAVRLSERPTWQLADLVHELEDEPPGGTGSTRGAARRNLARR
jgi:DNA-binding SARP family transcriptional activator